MQTKSPSSTIPLIHALFRSCSVTLLCTLISACAPSLVGLQSLYVHQPDPVEVSIWPLGSTPTPGLTCQTGVQYLLCTSQEPIDLTKDVQPYIQINWYVKTDGWAFTRGNGIVFKTQPPYFLVGGGATDRDYLAVSKLWERQLYRYTINVTNGTTTLSWDPWIAND